jgi:UDP-N-acetylmuramate: L-alanyl-gamma-D-glutamyl-meso-diaminopimelate ligase
VEDENGASFELFWRGQPWENVHWTLPGLFNARNAAVAALAAGLALHPADPTRLSLVALADFQGVRRRQETLRQDNRLAVVEDFGHHPTAVRETLVALRRRHPGRILLACFEPRSNTARTRAFQAELPGALALADHVFIGPVHRAEKTPAAERLDLDAICAEINAGASSSKARHFSSNQEVLRAALAASQSLGAQRHLAVFFSNGSFDGIIAEFARQA